jgi:hypothetical protein
MHAATSLLVIVEFQKCSILMGYELWAAYGLGLGVLSFPSWLVGAVQKKTTVR